MFVVVPIFERLNGHWEYDEWWVSLKIFFVIAVI